MVTLAAYGSVSDTYYTQSTSTHVDHDGIPSQAALKDRYICLLDWYWQGWQAHCPYLCLFIASLDSYWQGWQAHCPYLCLPNYQAHYPWFNRKGWQAHCFTGFILTGLASSLSMSMLANRRNKIIHTISYEICGDHILLALQKHAPRKTHIYAYLYICISQGKQHVHTRVSTWSHKLGCSHTRMRRDRAWTRLNALVWHQRSTGEVRALPQKKKGLSAFTRNFGLHLLYVTSDGACNARDKDCGNYITSA